MYKQKIIDLLLSTKREGIDKLINWLENKSDFFTAPASTKYHGNYNQGLQIHSYLVYDLLKKKVDFWRKEKPELKLPLDESLIIIGLLHDICKSNIYKKGIRNVKEDGKWIQKDIWECDDNVPLGHGEKSVIMLQNFIKLTNDELYGIRWHMGRVNDYIQDQQFSKAIEKHPIVLLTHLADYESSYLLENSEK